MFFGYHLRIYFKSWNINKNFHIVEAAATAALKTRLKILDFFFEKSFIVFSFAAFFGTTPSLSLMRDSWILFLFSYYVTDVGWREKK